MSRLTDLFQGLIPTTPAHPSALSNEQIAEILKTSPEALAAFTASYSSFEEATDVADEENLFATNSRQAARARRQEKPDSTAPAVDKLISRIADELEQTPALPVGPSPASGDQVTIAEVNALPEAERPQLTGTMMRKDIADDAYPVILSQLIAARQRFLPQEIERGTLQAIAMLDTMDLDPVMYQMLSQNPAAMSHWLPQLEQAVAATGFFRVPETTIRQVPLPILQMTRLDYSELTATTLAIIDEWTRRAFDLDETKDHFIKTGTFSSKFDFRNARVPAGQETQEIGQYLTFIQFQANQMASPLNGRPTAGVSTTNEWVVREWIEDESGSPSIYHGMPLRTEFRVFIDCDTDEVLAVAPYWDPEAMLERFEQQADAADPDMRHDAIVFRAHQEVLTERFERFKDVVGTQVEALLPELELTGQWSLDIMLNDDAGEQLYAIDMAPAHTSALAHHVPAGKLKTARTNWIPQLEI